MTGILSSADLAVARRIELANAGINARSANSMEGAAAESFGGGWAIYGGQDSPMTHALGMGMSGPVDVAELERMEAFFRERGTAAVIDLSVLADESVAAFVRERPYRVLEFNNVLVRRLLPEQGSAGHSDMCIDARPDPEEWARVVAHGFSGDPVPPPAFTSMLATMAAAVDKFVARVEGGAAAGAAMAAHEGVVWFFGDATIPAMRRRGLQNALIEARLRAAAAAGCDLAAASVLPGSGSHRNYERAGFQLLYTLVNVRREWEP